SLVRTITVAGRATVTALAASPTTITKGQAVTLTASVRATTAGAATPTGTVTFKDGSKVVGTGALSGGVARLTLTTLAVGTHTLTAVYSGAGADLGSGSGSVAVTVRSVTPPPPPPTTSRETTTYLTSSHTAVNRGQAVTLSALV